MDELEKQKIIEDILTRALRTPSVMSKMANAMANPLRRSLDYKSLSRSFIKVRRMTRKIIGSTFKCVKPAKKHQNLVEVFVRNRVKGMRGPQYSVKFKYSNGAEIFGWISYAKLRGKRFVQV